MAEAADELLLLETTSSAPERNAIALRLAHQGTAGLPPVLASLISRNELQDHRGTLVHCLAMFDCRAYVGLLSDLLVSGNWEVAHEALDALATIEDAQGPSVEEASLRIGQALRSEAIEDWRRDLLTDAAEAFG